MFDLLFTVRKADTTVVWLWGTARNFFGREKNHSCRNVCWQGALKQDYFQHKISSLKAL